VDDGRNGGDTSDIFEGFQWLWCRDARHAMTATASTLARSRPATGKSVVLGTILGIDTIGHCVALATLAFAGPLAFALGYGTMLILLSSAVMSFVLAWRSVFPGAAGIAEDTTIAILAPAMVVAAGSLDGPPEAQVATAVAIMGVSTLLSGVAIYLIGRFHLGRLVRLMPFPVAAGFLAASGWLLVASALFLLTGTGSLSELAARLTQDGVPLNLVLGLGLAVALMAASYRIGGALAVVLPLTIAVTAFYIGLSLAGLSFDEARMRDYLPATIANSLPAWPDPSLLGHVDWPAVATTSLTIAAVVLLNAVGFMLNVGGIEMATRSDVSIDTEARVTGAANIGIGAFGGLLGFVASDSTIMAHKLGCSARSMGLALGVTTAIGVLFAAQIVAHVPIFVAAGLLLFFGMMMLTDWLILSRARLRPLDWAIIPIILAATIAIDILAAIAVGLVAALLIFVYTYASQPVIRFQGSGATRRSPVDRTPEDEAVLARRGARIHILGLHLPLLRLGREGDRGGPSPHGRRPAGRGAGHRLSPGDRAGQRGLRGALEAWPAGRDGPIPHCLRRCPRRAGGYDAPLGHRSGRTPHDPLLCHAVGRTRGCRGRHPRRPRPRNPGAPDAARPASAPDAPRRRHAGPDGADRGTAR
jgi:SulP family sulfate permease